MEQIASFDFMRLRAGNDGGTDDAAQVSHVVSAATSGRYSDVVLIAHGFRNSEAEAESLYTRFAEGFDGHRARPELAETLGGRTFLFVGVFWPSKKFTENEEADDGSAQGFGDDDGLGATEAQLALFLQDATDAQRREILAAFADLRASEDDPQLQDRFVTAVLDAVPFDDADGMEGLTEIRSKAGNELLASLETPIFLPTSRSDSEGGVSSVALDPESDDGGVLMLGGFFRSVMGRVGQVLNMGTWYTMKKRSGDVGARLVADTVRSIAGSARAPRVHFVGHSLGGRLMASAAKALATPPTVHVASLTLLEAAFSHYGFSSHVQRESKPGFFRDVVASQVVRGPLISTFSYQDTVVGRAYSIASRLAGDTVKAVGDKDDRFGGIGRNGAQQTDEVTAHLLEAPGHAYRFVTGTVNNIDGSGGGILDHGDVTNEKVTHAFAVAIAHT